MTDINLPFICSKCGNLFPSGIVIGSDVRNFTSRGNWASVGTHSGPIMDGTFDAIDGVLQIKQAGKATKLIVAKIRAHAQEAAAGRVAPQKALDEISSLLPQSTAVALQALGATNPWFAIFLILSILGGLTEIASGLTTVYKAFFSGDETPLIVNEIDIFNDIRIDGGSKVVSKNRKERRRQQHHERHKKKVI